MIPIYPDHYVTLDRIHIDDTEHHCRTFEAGVVGTRGGAAITIYASIPFLIFINDVADKQGVIAKDILDECVVAASGAFSSIDLSIIQMHVPEIASDKSDHDTEIYVHSLADSRGLCPMLGMDPDREYEFYVFLYLLANKWERLKGDIGPDEVRWVEYHVESSRDEWKACDWRISREDLEFLERYGIHSLPYYEDTPNSC